MISNFPVYNLSTFLFKLLEPLAASYNLSISILFTSNLKLPKSVLLAKSDVSTPVSYYKSAFVASLDKSNSTFAFAPKDFGFGK